ncbi:MAG: hypothetical protein ACC633_01350 [Anaerolineales bacterium]
MPKKRLIIIILAGFIIFLLLIIATGLVILRRQPAAPPPDIGPTVLITSPGPDGNRAPSQSINIQAAAYGDNPIHHLELWLDGERVQIFFNQELNEASPLEISFNQLLTTGPHLLFVRAVDSHDLIGQSLPITAVGTLAITGDGPLTLNTIQPGDTLDETLAANGTDLAAVLPYNPGLGASASPGTNIAIPVPPEGGNPPAGNPPSPQANGIILDVLEMLPIGYPPLALIPAQALGPPSAPSGLQASISVCNVNLTWTDTSDNEAGYNIWVTGLGLPPRIAARADAAEGTGAVSVELQAVGSGDFVYWVEAYNVVGSQPSNQVQVSFSGSCPNQLNSSLMIEAVDFSAPASYDRAYCYVSLEGNPEVRLPSSQDQFIQVAGGKSDLTSLPVISRSFSTAIPGDQSLEVIGECWGWAGGSLSKLGVFNQTVAQSLWDGARIPLTGPSFEIGLRVSIAQEKGKIVLFAAPDPGIAPPKILKLEAAITLADVGIDPFESYDYLDRGNLRTLTWDWFPYTPGTTTITGSTILINGVPFKQIADPAARSAEIRVPGFCGTKLEISLVANVDASQSLPSNIITDQQPPCTLYAVVDFKQVRFGWTNDSLNPSNKCDTLQSYFNISVTEIYDRFQTNERQGRKQVKSFWGGGFYMPVRCGRYDMNQIAGNYYTKDERNPTQIVVPLRLVEGHSTAYVIEAAMWDYDSWSGDDLIARFNGNFYLRLKDVESLLKKMHGSPKMIKDYYCDSYIGYFNGDAYSRMDVCVDIYADNPSTGASTVPSNAPLPEPAADGPTVTPGLQFKPVSDIGVIDSFIDPNGFLTVRIRNEGPDDLVNATLTSTTSIKTDDPKVSGSPWTQSFSYFELKKNARTELHTWTWDKLDPTKYSYEITVEIATEGFADTNPSNNKGTYSFTASALQTVPDPLMVDLQISDIHSTGNGYLNVVVRNGGPDVFRKYPTTVTCEATEISRMAGTGVTTMGLERFAFPYLQPDDTENVTPIHPDFKFNLLLNWYILSCQVKAEGAFKDLNPANNFLTKPVY